MTDSLRCMTKRTSSKTPASSRRRRPNLRGASVDLNYALAHSALAVVLQKLGRHEEAIEHARRVCEIEPDDPFSYTALSVTYQRAFRRHEQHGLHPHGGRCHGAKPDPARPALSRVGTAHHFSFIFGGRCPPSFRRHAAMIERLHHGAIVACEPADNNNSGAEQAHERTCWRKACLREQTFAVSNVRPAGLPPWTLGKNTPPGKMAAMWFANGPHWRAKALR